MGKKRGPKCQVNITVAIAVHPPPDGSEPPEVSVEVGQVGFEMPGEDEINAELDPDEEEEDEKASSVRAGRRYRADNLRFASQ
jgi:hypothetical protein